MQFDFIRFKNKGGLVNPSFDVVRICKECEKVCRIMFRHSANTSFSSL